MGLGMGMVTSGILSVLVLPLTQAAFFTPAPSPDLDLDQLGQIALTGNFDAVSLYSFVQDKEGGPAGYNGSQSQSLLATLPDGGIVPVFSADADILAMCSLTVNDSSSASIVVGGNFTSLGGVESQGIALFDPDSTSITAIPGLSGQVLALYCDEESSTVYLGGDFRKSNSTNAMTWSSKSGLSNLPFGGFNGPVTSIVQSNKGRVLFAGSFDGLGNMSASPSQKDEQLINIETAHISSGVNSPTPGFDNPRNVICPGEKKGEEGNNWLLPDHAPGFWRADMSFAFQPTKLRVRNTQVEGRGTKTFRFTAIPDNGILNMTYTDPDSGDTVACDARCPLSNDPEDEFRDFRFVNVVGMSGFQLDISEWYGKGAGLNGVELFSDDIYAYAVDKFNEPSCADVPFGSKATKTGSWTAMPSQDSAADYLSAKVDPSKDSAAVTLHPDIKRTGNYSVIIFTPGCVQDGTCATRGSVNVTATLDSSADEPVQKTVSQTNNFDKYDQIYFGHVDKSSDDFLPSVKIAAQRDEPGEIDIVASRVRFQQVSSTGGLNGLYEFDPSEKEVSSANFTKSAINKAGIELDTNAKVDSLEWADETLFVGGNFSNSSTQNIFSFTDGKSSSLADGGLDSGVTSLLLLDDLLYVGGNFSDTAKGGSDGLKSVAVYDISDESWLPLGSGVNGPVTSLVQFPLNISSDDPETTIAVSGQFTKINKVKDRSAIDAEGFAVWVPSKKKWLEELDVDHMAYVGRLTASVKIDDETLVAGNLASGGIASRGAASLMDNDGPAIQSLPIDINLEESESPSRKRFIETEYAQGVLTGLFDNSSKRNLTILAGHFSATATDDSTINNLLFLDGADKDTVTGAGSGIDEESTFLALGIQKDLLFAGGIVSGRVADSDVNGLAVYDLTESKFFESQPADLDGDDVVVRAISPRPDSDHVYIGGQFQSAGTLPCPSVCIYEIDGEQWVRPGTELRGNVSSLMWTTNDKLVAAGNLTISGNQTTLASYDTEKQTWSVISGKSSENIKGEITALSLATQDGSQFWVSGKSTNGSAFLVLYDGEEFLSVGSLFGENTTIQGIQIIKSKENHDETDFLEKSHVLLITGRLQLPDFGIVSGALFNGTAVAPFILSSTADGEPGSITGLFSEHQVDLHTGKKPRSRGIVVLISFCIALGCVFLIVLIGILLGRIRRYRQGYVTAPQGTDRKPDLKRVPPEYLLDSLRHRTPGVPTV